MKDCRFCSVAADDKQRLVYEYNYWYLFLQMPEKLETTKQAAGLMISKRHMESVTDADPEEAIELLGAIKDAASRLCERVSVTYANQETIGFNQGRDAGQTQFHAHVHVLPVAKEDPGELKIRGGIGGAFEALKRERLGQNT